MKSLWVAAMIFTSIASTILIIILVIRFFYLLKVKFYHDNSEMVRFIDFVPKVKNKLLKFILNFLFLNVLVTMGAIRLYTSFLTYENFGYRLLVVFAITAICSSAFYLANRINNNVLKKIKIPMYIELVVIIATIFFILTTFLRLFEYFEVSYFTS